MHKKFYGWWVAIACFFTYGLAVGIPYYGHPFFYDYYEKTFHWTRKEITFGFPLAATFSLLIGPLLVHRFRPRHLILIGTACTGLAFLGFGTMGGSLWLYYFLWLIYIIGYTFSGPIPHQVLVSQWFRKHRGKAMAIVYLGVGVFGGIFPKYVAKPLTEAFGFQTALMIMGALLVLVWPLAIFVLKDRPSDIGQTPDGLPATEASLTAPPQSFGYLLRQPAFWLLAIGSLCSIGSIGSINQHMKFIFKESGFTDQAQLNDVFANANLCILFSSIGGRIVMGWLADQFSKKVVMAVTYLMVALTIPLLLLVNPNDPNMVYTFAVLFGFGMGADYMLIPMMAADQFGVNTLARAMAIILPADTIGQTWCPYVVSMLHDHFNGYQSALYAIFGLSFVGAAAILLLPKPQQKHEALPLQEPSRVAARR